VFATLAGEELLAAVEPCAAEERTGGEGSDAVGAWPVARGRQQTLFCGVGQYVAHACVRGFVVGDDDGAVATRPKALTPEVEASCFLCDVGIHKLHEQRELAGAGG
jgi:hypothetical protein